MKINAIYPTYQGEVNLRGIGAPVIFVRTQGCHLRCYLKTIGFLCDTPEALDPNDMTNARELTPMQIVDEVKGISKSVGGIDYVCLSGGDPLYHDKESIHELLKQLGIAGFQVSIETSGTLSIAEYTKYKHVTFVIDYKGKSAGIKPKFLVTDLPYLTKDDFIKFVIYDDADYQEFFELVMIMKKQTKAPIAVGVYWGGKLSYDKLIKYLSADLLLGQVVINMQAHKLITLYDNSDVSSIIIPAKI